MSTQGGIEMSTPCRGCFIATQKTFSTIQNSFLTTPPQQLPTMMENMNVIQIENLWKEYRLGVIGHGTLTKDLQSWVAKIRGKEDPNAKIGQVINGQQKQVEGNHFWALQNINLQVKEGELLGIIGKNGAGKSTLLKIMSRVTAPSKGTIKIKGRIASLLEVGTGFHPELTGRENVFLNGAILGMSKNEVKRKFEEIVDFSGIESFIDTPVKRYSSGMYVRLAFAVAAHLEPEILIIDEVLAVGDADFQKKCLGKMSEVANTGRTVLFVSHNLGAVSNLCKKTVLIENGKIIESSSTQEVVSKYLLCHKVLDHQKIETTKERSGNQKVIFSDFFVENIDGKQISIINANENVVFVFTINVSVSNYDKIDIGFSLHDQLDNIITVLYSSYQNVYFSKLKKGKHTVKLKISELPIGFSRIGLKGRILVDKDESDWPKIYLGFIDIERGNYYLTGNSGFVSGIPFLLKGEWE